MEELLVEEFCSFGGGVLLFCVMDKKMKRYIQIIILVFSINTLAISQESKFEWKDSIFQVGQKREIKLLFGFDGPCTRILCYEYEDNGKTIDTLVSFMMNNPNIEIQIAYHQDQRGNEDYNQKLSEIWAKGTKEGLELHGIENERIESKGYGETMPIIPLTKIKNMKKEKQKEDAHRTNRRIEIIITKI